jgi:23S rRNA pseudouridine2605 synthase
MTNDSEWAARIASPEEGVNKTYHVQIGAVAKPELLQKIQRGMRELTREMLRVKRVSVVRSGVRNSWLEIVLDEGKNRQIRRIMRGLGIEVLRLIRIGIGPIRLGDLAKGQWRELTREEVAALWGRDARAYTAKSARARRKVCRELWRRVRDFAGRSK